MTYEELISRIQPIKESFMARCALKWGKDYTFEQYLQLENLLVSTMRANDISNPLQIDAIKKACKISIQLDAAIMASDSKGIKDLSAAYSAFTKTAQIDNVIAAANNDVITTVADLGDYIEKCGGRFKFYDNVERDIVDTTIKDIKDYIRTLVQDCTGLGSVLENITETYKRSIEEQATSAATSTVSIQDLIDNNVEGSNTELDAELAQQTLDDIDIGDDNDDEYF